MLIRYEINNSPIIEMFPCRYKPLNLVNFSNDSGTVPKEKKQIKT